MPTSNIVDKGGKIFKTGKLQLIFWGSGWDDNPDQNPRKIDVIEAFKRLCNGPFFTHLLQYRKIKPPLFLDPVIITNTITVLTSSITKAQAEQCIEDSITRLGAVDFRLDPNVFYIIIPTNGNDPVDGSFHWRFIWNGFKGYYAIAPGTAATGGAGGALGVHTIRYLKHILGLLTAPDNGFDLPGFSYNTNTVKSLPAFDEIHDKTSISAVTDGGYMAPAYESNEESAIIVPDGSPLVLPQADAGADSFGVKKIYFDDTSKTAENWTMANLSADSRIRVDGTITNLGGGVWEGHVTSSDNPASFRINVNTTNPNAMDPTTQSVLGTHWDQMAVAGYMVDARDFRNVEMTIYWKAVSWSDDDEMSIYARGGRHSSGWPAGCLGPCYKGQIQRAGNSRWAKEYHHVSGSTGYVFTAGHNTSSLSARNNVWTGQKTVIFDKTVNGKKIVRMEVWCDTTGDSNPASQNWQMINWIEDSGSFGEPSDKGYVSNCHAIAQQMFLWGGPTATFRIDNVVVQVKKATVRNILPEGSTGPPGPTPCPTGQHFDTALGRCVIDDNGPPPPPSDTPVSYIKFYNSGSSTQANPFQSLGGPISNVELIPDSFNNLWDTLTVADQRDGKKSTRVIYVKNTDPTFGLPVTQAYFGETDNYMSMSLGAVPKNTTEPGTVTEVEDHTAYFALNSTGGITTEPILVQALNNTITRLADHFTDATSSAIGKKITRLTIYVRKVGAPTGTISAKLLSSANAVKLTFTTTFNVATAIPLVSSDFVALTFEKLDNSTIAIASGDRLDVEYLTGTAVNYIEISIKKTAQSPGIALDTSTNGTTWVNIPGDPTLLTNNPVPTPGAALNPLTRVTQQGLAIDRGGIVLSNARIVLIYWGSNVGGGGGGGGANVVPNRTQFDTNFRAMLSSFYFSKLRQYASIEIPTFFASFNNTTTPYRSPAYNVSDLLAVVSDTITQHADEIKPSAADSTVSPFIYIVIPDGTIDTDNPDGGAGGGGYHTFGNTSDGDKVYVIAMGAYAHTQDGFDSVSAIVSRQIIQTITDPEYPTGIVIPSTTVQGGYSEIVGTCITGDGQSIDNLPIISSPGPLGLYADYINGVLCSSYYSNVDGICVLPPFTTTEYSSTGSAQATGTTPVTSVMSGKLETGGNSTTTTGKIFYNGGTFTINLKVFLIFWGPQWATQSAPSQAEIISAVQTICSSTYMTALSQYGGIQKATYIGMINNTSNFVDTVPAASSIVHSLIAAKLVPDFQVDPSICYMFIAPKNITAVHNGAGLGYHTADAISKDNGVTWIPFILSVCSATDLHQAGATISHEIVEATTNDLRGFFTIPPVPNENAQGWVANTHIQIKLPGYDEIGDVCDYNSSGDPQFTDHDVNGVNVEGYWSNADAACIAPTTDQSRPGISIFTSILDFSPSLSGSVVKMDNNRTKIAEHIWGTLTDFWNEKIAKVDVFIRKVGVPTGSLKCSIKHGERVEIDLLVEGKYSEVFAFSPLYDVSSLPVSNNFTKVTFTKVVTTDYDPDNNDAIMFEYTDGTSTDYIEFAISGEAFDLNNPNLGANVEAFSDPASLWDDYRPDGVHGCDLALVAYINSSFCFGSGQPGTGGSTGVVFKQPTTYDTGLPIGQLNPGDYKSIILQRDIPANAPNDEDAATELIVAAGGTITQPPGPTTCPSGQHFDAVTGTCVANPPPVGGGGATIYPATGQTTTAVDSGATTRHFASDGSSPTTEREVNNCPYENYEMTAYMNIPSDEATFKMYGPTHSDSNRAWYLTVVSSNGDTHFGWEDPHPTTNKDCAQGANIGNVGSKVIGIKAVIWKLSSGGAHVELWTDTDGKWTKRLAADNPCGKVYTKASSQQVLFRIDARPVIFQSATVAEIKPSPSPASITAFQYDDAQDTTNLSPSSVAGTNALQSESNEEDNDVS